MMIYWICLMVFFNVLFFFLIMGFNDDFMVIS